MKRLLLILAAVVVPAVLSAQATIKVQAPNMVGSGEQFNVTFIVEGEESVSDFSWEPGDAFQLVWGPQRGSSTSISIVNGKRTKSSQSTFSYILLPRKTGSFRLPVAEAVVGGERLVSKSVTVEVVPEGGTASSGGSEDEPRQESQTRESGSVSSSDLYMRLIFSKKSVVVGEPVSATLKLYQRVSIAGFEDARFPSFEGFWSQETLSPTNIEFHRENIGDVIYNTAVLRAWTLIPQKAGDIKVDPAELVCLVNVRLRHASTGSIFDSFFQDDYQTIRKRVSTPAATLHVSALPGGAPASFGGGVGSYRMSASLSRDSLRTHDAASLKVTVTGSGNIALLEAPKISFPPDFEVYDIKSQDIAGGKVFEYPFIPRSHGDFTVGPVEYSYYDVSSGRYVTLSSSPMHLHVSKGADDGAMMAGSQTVAAPVGRKDVKNIGSDIRYIITSAQDFASGDRFFVGSAWFWILLSLLVAAAVAVYVVYGMLQTRRADVAGNKNRGAAKMAHKRLAVAEGYLKGGLCSPFYEELHKALLGFVSDKLNMDLADMSKENIAARLASAGVPEDLCSRFVTLLDDCEFARYSPSSDPEMMSGHFESGVNVISGMEENMKRKRSGNAVGAALVAIALLLPGAAGAADGLDSLWTAGVAAYDAGEWRAASDAWNAILSQGGESAALWYNIGNAEFKNGELAKAVLAYERALKIDPSLSDARFNLEFAASRTQDRIDQVPEFFLKTWCRRFGYGLPAGVWTLIFFVCFALLLASALLLMLSGSGSVRKAGFFAGLALAVVCAVSLACAISQKRDSSRQDRAVVMSAVASVKSSPGDSSTDLFVLHEGTEVKVLDSIGEWSNVELSDGRQGWLKSRDAEII